MYDTGKHPEAVAREFAKILNVTNEGMCFLWLDLLKGEKELAEKDPTDCKELKKIMTEFYNAIKQADKGLISISLKQMANKKESQFV